MQSFVSDGLFTIDLLKAQLEERIKTLKKAVELNNKLGDYSVPELILTEAVKIKER